MNSELYLIGNQYAPSLHIQKGPHSRAFLYALGGGELAANQVKCVIQYLSGASLAPL